MLALKFLWTAALLFLLCQCASVKSARAAEPTFPAPESPAIVRAAQRLLRAQGYPVQVDGRFGADTRQALTKFQRARKLRPDGVLGNRTWRALIVRIRPGDKGEAVRAVQELLNGNSKEYGSNPTVAVDGVYGVASQRAVERFQAEWRLGRDRIVGPATWSTLLHGMSRVGFYD